MKSAIELSVLDMLQFVSHVLSKTARIAADVDGSGDCLELLLVKGVAMALGVFVVIDDV